MERPRIGRRSRARPGSPWRSACATPIKPGSPRAPARQLAWVGKGRLVDLVLKPRRPTPCIDLEERGWERPTRLLRQAVTSVSADEIGAPEARNRSSHPQLHDVRARNHANAAVSVPAAPIAFGAVPEGSEFAARVYAAINARDRGAIKALCAPDVVVGTTVEAYRGPEAVLEWLDEGDDAFDDFTVEVIEVEELAGDVLVSMRQRGRGKASGAESTTASRTSGPSATAARSGCSPSRIRTTRFVTPRARDAGNPAARRDSPDAWQGEGTSAGGRHTATLRARPQGRLFELPHGPARPRPRAARGHELRTARPRTRLRATRARRHLGRDARFRAPAPGHRSHMARPGRKLPATASTRARAVATPAAGAKPYADESV
jgi:hypothetical protein